MTGAGLMALGAAALRDEDDDESFDGDEAEERMIQDYLGRLVYEQAMRDGVEAEMPELERLRYKHGESMMRG